MAAETVPATWIGPFEATMADGTQLVPGETEAVISAAEAEESAYWRPKGGQKAKAPKKSAAERKADAAAKRAAKAAERKAAKESAAAEERRKAEAEAAAAEERRKAAEHDQEAKS